MNKNLYPHMKILQSKKLYLRPITLDDANDIFEYLSQEKVVKYLPIKAHKNINETKKFISNYFINNYENNKYSHYAVVYKKENKVIWIRKTIWLKYQFFYIRQKKIGINM